MPWKYPGHFFLKCCEESKYLTDLTTWMKCPWNFKDTSKRDLKKLLQFIMKFRLRNVLEMSRTFFVPNCSKESKYYTDLTTWMKCPCNSEDMPRRDLKELFQFIVIFRLKNVLEISRTFFFLNCSKKSKYYLIWQFEWNVFAISGTHLEGIWKDCSKLSWNLD